MNKLFHSRLTSGRCPTEETEEHLRKTLRNVSQNENVKEMLTSVNIWMKNYQVPDHAFCDDGNYGRPHRV